MTKIQFTRTETQPHQNRKFRQCSTVCLGDRTDTYRRYFGVLPDPSSDTRTMLFFQIPSVCATFKLFWRLNYWSTLVIEADKNF